MAVLKSKQLPTRLSGSYVLSGSNQTLHGTTTIHGNTTISGSVQNLKGSSADFRIRQDDDTTLVKLETDSGGSSALLLYDNKYHSGGSTVDINSADSTALVIKSGSSTIFTVDRDNTLISGSSTSTGSFGYGIISDKLEVTDAIYASFGTNAVPTTGRSSFQGQTDFYNGTTVRGFIYAGAGGIQFGTYGGTDKNIDFAINNSNRMGLTNTSLNFVDNVNISGSSTSTGSFGTLETSGVINATGRIFENGTSVIDHATAMAIVFGG